MFVGSNAPAGKKPAGVLRLILPATGQQIRPSLPDIFLVISDINQMKRIAELCHNFNCHHGDNFERSFRS
jgi:hypothetical protein